MKRSDLDDLIPWLRAQLDDDERTARESVGKGSPEWTAELDVNGGGASVSDGNGYRLIKPGGELDLVDAEHIARHDPVRVLAEVDAKRRLLELHSSPDPSCDECGYVTPCATVRLLALPYADRPGYRPEWAPNA